MRRRGTLGVSVILAAVTLLHVCSAASNAADESIAISPRGAHSGIPVMGTDGPAWSKTTVALGVTLGTAIIALFLVRRFMPGLSQEPRAGQIQILSQAPLGARGIVYVLRCGPRVLIVGATGSNISTLAEIA